MPRKPVPRTTRRGLDAARSALAARLARGWTVDVAARSVDGGSVRFTAPDGSSGEMTLRIRRGIGPRAAEALGSPSEPTVVMSDWLSPRTRDVLDAAGWSYVDATGNVLVALERPGLLIRTEGAARDPSPKRTPGPNLRGPRAWALQRTLAEVLPPYGVTDLAGALDIDPGYVSRLLNGLAEELLVTRAPRGPVEGVAWEPMLRQIATSYSLLRANKTTQWMAPGGAEQLLRDLSQSTLRGWAVTGSFAAARLVAVAAPGVAVVFTDDPERLADAMRLRPVRNGGNVVTALPYDRLVFERTWQQEGVVYASVAQIVIDCITGFGRMPAEADALIDWMRRRAPRWQAPSLTERAPLP